LASSKRTVHTVSVESLGPAEPTNGKCNGKKQQEKRRAEYINDHNYYAPLVKESKECNTECTINGVESMESLVEDDDILFI